jgi:hypothetical protein
LFSTQSWGKSKLAPSVGFQPARPPTSAFLTPPWDFCVAVVVVFQTTTAHRILCSPDASSRKTSPFHRATAASHPKQADKGLCGWFTAFRHRPCTQATTFVARSRPCKTATCSLHLWMSASRFLLDLSDCHLRHAADTSRLRLPVPFLDSSAATRGDQNHRASLSARLSTFEAGRRLASKGCGRASPLAGCRCSARLPSLHKPCQNISP